MAQNIGSLGPSAPLQSSDPLLQTLPGGGSFTPLATYTRDFGTYYNTIPNPQAVWTIVSYNNPQPAQMRVRYHFSSNPTGLFSIPDEYVTFYLPQNSSKDVTVTFNGYNTSSGIKTAVLAVEYWYTTLVWTDYYNLTAQIAQQPSLAFGSYGINFGNQYISFPSTGTARLKNTGSKTLTINSMSISGTDAGYFTLTSGYGAGTVAVGSWRDIGVQYNATASGTHNATIRINFTYDGVDYTWDYLPLTRQSSPVPQTPSFSGYGFENVGSYYLETVDGTARLSNDGSEILNITSVSISGSGFLLTGGGFAGVLSPYGGIRDLNMRYLANAMGSQSANIVVNYLYDGQPGSVTLPLSGTTFFRPRAQLWLDDQLMAQEPFPQSGTTETLTLSINHPYAANGSNFVDQTVSYPLKRWATYVIISDFGDNDEGLLVEQRQKKLSLYQDQGYSDTSPEVLTESLNVMGHMWMKETSLAQRIFDRWMDTRHVFHHRFRIMAQEEGYYIDIKAQYLATISRYGFPLDRRSAFRVGGLFMSALEHGILEQMQGISGQGVSTVRLLSLGNQLGDKIFRMDSNNYTSVSTQLAGYTSADLSLFQNGVTNGNVYILPQTGNLLIGQWQGKGYVELGQVNGGSGLGMVIGGGYYGGFNIFLGNLDPDRVSQNSVLEFVQPIYQKEKKVADPVNITTGNYIFEHKDLSLGHTEPKGLRLIRYCSSVEHQTDSALRYGWSHNYDISWETRTDFSASLGQRTPLDLAPLLAASVSIARPCVFGRHRTKLGSGGSRQ
ncbi:MAG: choice-of-anchor D domain-containing protein [Kiritimatiellae bacterium]|nr:choice-of-anchor D domain-containing protein [Kiritimatiellia bacterium]